MVNNRIRVFDLDGMIVRTPKFIADFEVKGNGKLNITLHSTEIVIHSGKYSKKDSIVALIQNLETEMDNNKENSKVILKVIEYIKDIYS